MTVLRYKSHGRIEDLEVGECTAHRASNSGAGRWWMLWFRVLRETDGQPEDFAVPINPGGGYIEQGPGGRTWGLVRPQATAFASGYGSSSTWAVSPSINVLDDRDAVAGTHEHPSLWHQTPEIQGVPDSEPWAQGAAP